MAGSVVVAVRKHLVALLEAEGDLASVLIHYSFPGYQAIGKESVTFGPAEAVVEPASHRAVKIRREETYVQRCSIGVAGDGITQEAADERCAEILATIEGLMAVQANVALTGAAGVDQQILHCYLSSWRQTSGPTEDGHGAGLDAGFTVTARSL